jgi:protoporphyrinogen oxidase
LGNYYLTNVADTSFPFTGVINMSTLVEGDASVTPDNGPFHGFGLTYIPKYALSTDEIFQKTDEEITAAFIAQLARIYPHVKAEDIVATRVARAPHVFPFPEQGRVERVQTVSRAKGSIVVINAARLLSATLNVNDTMNVIEEGLRGLLSDRTTMTAENGERIAREAARRAIA